MARDLLRPQRMRIAVVLVGLGLTACNGGDRDSDPMTGTAGASASASTTGSGATDSEASGADGSASETGPASTSGGPGTSGVETQDGSETSASATTEGGNSSSGGAGEGSSSSTGGGLIVDGVLGINIVAHNDCTFTTNPESITVPEGTEFTVNWISDPTSEVEFDIAKIDPFNAVPIVLGLEIGNSYHDDIREWCGDLFTGTFDFRLTSCSDHHYIPVDCGG